MIRQLRLSDLPRLAFPGRLRGYDLARSRETLMASDHRLSLFEFARHSISLEPNRHSLAMVDGLRIRALAVVQQRQGSRAWELAHFYTSPATLTRCSELLEQSGMFVAKQGAERLFLRIEQDSPLQVLARRAGFFPAFGEVIYEQVEPQIPGSMARYLHLRPPSGADSYGLFRLYNAAVPAQVRSVVGLTLGQWADAQEKTPPNTVEYVWERAGELRGWLRIANRMASPVLEVLLHPDESAATALICNEVLGLLGSMRPPVWVVPTYQSAFASTLQQDGWVASQSYVILVKQLAKTVGELMMTPAQA